MISKTTRKLVPMIEDVVKSVELYAASQGVCLTFNALKESQSFLYTSNQLPKEIAFLLRKVILFTPTSQEVKIYLTAQGNGSSHQLLCIENLGIDLSKVGEIIANVSEAISVESLNNGTRFTLKIPTGSCSQIDKKKMHSSALLPKKYPLYYANVQRRLTTHFSSIAHLEKSVALKSDAEGAFLKNVNALIHRNLEDSEFGVASLACELGMSRTQLYRKLKFIIQKSPQHYLRLVRLKQARNLLQDTENGLNVSEVCYRVGFSGKSHFTRSFRKEFGFNPSEVLKTSV